MTDLVRRDSAPVDDEQKQTFAGIYILKKLDLKPEDGGLEFPVVLPSALSPLDDVLQQLAVDNLVKINTRRERWDITKEGLAYLAEHIDEAEALIEEFDDDELPDVIAELRERNLDVLRARFLWGWFDGEFDDLVVFQQRRGVNPIESFWAFYLMSDEFYAEIAKDFV